MADVDLGFYPDILHNSLKGWRVEQVEPINAAVDLENRVGYVPDALTEIDRCIQNHEYGHVKITDAGRERGTIYEEFRYFLEEVRVNNWLASNNIRYVEALDGFKWAAMPRPSDKLRAALAWLQVSTYILPREPDKRPADLNLYMANIQEHFTANDLRMLTDAYNDLVRGGLKRKVRDELAQKLADHFGKIDPPKEKPGETKESYERERKEEKERREKAKERAEERDKEPGRLKGGAVQLGKMEIHRHLTKTKPGRRIAQPFGSTDTGAVPTMFMRKNIDGKLFKRQKATGAIIIDCSGSMHWNWDQLRELVKKLPNLTIAKYQGYYNRGSGIIGRLCVLAEKGRWAPPEDEPGLTGDNNVDYEALEWGAKVTDGPVVWLSDGQIVDGPRSPLETIGMIDKLMRKRGIVRIDNADGATKYFAKKPTEVYRQCGSRFPRKGRMK